MMFHNTICSIKSCQKVHLYKHTYTCVHIVSKIILNVTSCHVHIHCVPKNVTTLPHCNSDVHESILIIFVTDVSEKVGNQKVLYFPTSPN